MNYQQAIADAIKLIRSVAAATVTTTGSAAGSGFLSCFPAAADAAADSVSATATDAAVVVTATTTTADAAAGSGFCFCSAAVAAATTAADAANVLIPEGSHMRALTPCNILAVEKTDRSVYWDAHSHIRKYATSWLRLAQYSLQISSVVSIMYIHNSYI